MRIQIKSDGRLYYLRYKKHWFSPWRVVKDDYLTCYYAQLKNAIAVAEKLLTTYWDSKYVKN